MGVILSRVGYQNPARALQADIGRLRRVRWLGAGAVVLVGLVAAGCGVPPTGSGFPNPPRHSPVTTVLVSADGRVITGVGTMACGHDPRLDARSYPGKVTLRWVNPDTNCHSETIESVVARIRLPEPLGTRRLVQAASGGEIPYFDQRELARVTVLPPGFQFRSQFPVGQPVADTRTYAGPPGTGVAGPGWPCRCAELVISQQAAGRGFIPPAQQASQHPIRVRVHGQVATLLVNGAYDRSINWAGHGYYFTVTVLAYGHRKVALSDAQLIAVADGIRLQPGSARHGA